MKTLEKAELVVVCWKAPDCMRRTTGWVLEPGPDVVVLARDLTEKGPDAEAETVKIEVEAIVSIEGLTVEPPEGISVI